MAKGDDREDNKNDNEFVFNHAWHVKIGVQSQFIIPPEGSMKVGADDVNGAV